VVTKHSNAEARQNNNGDYIEAGVIYYQLSAYNIFISIYKRKDNSQLYTGKC